TDALLNWKASLQNEILSLLPSWTLHPNNATNSFNDQNTISIPCSWFGISCSHAGGVIKLNLTNSGLKGTLHEFYFSCLPNLAYVDLSMNELYGIVPIEITYLSKQIYLTLSFNNNLAYVYRYDNQLSSSIPTEFGKLPKLVELDINNNSLTGPIPSSIGNLEKLTLLHICNNQLVRTYVFHLLGTYVTILCNWLIL
ncbi:putative leucine-rich repeat receptor-like protein kinase, partial [Quercus suber]